MGRRIKSKLMFKLNRMLGNALKFTRLEVLAAEKLFREETIYQYIEV